MGRTGRQGRADGRRPGTGARGWPGLALAACLGLAAAITSLGLAAPAAAERLERQVQTDAGPRPYILHLPDDPALRAGPLSVIFALHPGFGTAAGYERQLALHLWPGAEAYAVVYPEGHQRSWNHGDCCGPAREAGLDDVAFLRAILTDLETVMQPARGRHFATGFSNGAGMSQELACRLSDEIAAIAIAGGTRDMSGGCRLARPVPVLMMHGMEDPVSPFAGGVGVLPRPGFRPAAPGNAAFWAEVNGCRAQDQVTRLGGIACTRHSACRDGGGGVPQTEVVFCPIPGMGHWFPGLRALSPDGPALFGPPREDLPGRSAVLEFFAAH